MNLRHRQNTIDCDYLNGVKDLNGKQVIRSLNKEEAAWLNRFYEETNNCSKIDENDFYEDKREFYKEDYRRRNDTFNIANMLGNLDEINYSTFAQDESQIMIYEDILIYLLDEKLKREKWFKKKD